MRRARAARVLVAILGLGIAGCQQPGPPTPTPPASSSPAASLAVDPSSSLGGAVVDPTLLEILPSEVAGIPIVPDPETAASIAADPGVAAEVEALAVAIGVSAGSSSGGEDIVIASVVRLRPDVFDDAFFEGWRDSYDRAACEPAGGVVGSSEQSIGGRQVFVGTCQNGGRSLHLRYGEDVIVSLTSTGEGRLGELVVERLGG